MWALSQEYTPLLIYLVAGEKHAERSINQKHVHKYFKRLNALFCIFFLNLIYQHTVINSIRGRNTLGNMFSIQTDAQLNLQKILFSILTLRNNSRFCGMYQLGIKRPNLFFLSKVFNTCHEMLLLSFQVWVIYSCLFKTL